MIRVLLLAEVKLWWGRLCAWRNCLRNGPDPHGHLEPWWPRWLWR